MIYTLSRTGHYYKGNTHTHTTMSDGDHTPADTVEIYKNAGYDFLAITDHNKWGNYPELCTDKFLVLPGSEIDTVYEGAVHHIVTLGTSECTLPCGYRIPAEKHCKLHPQAIIDYAKENNAIAIYAHPFWSYCDHALLASLKGLTAVEIINYSCEQEWKAGLAQEHFEFLWRDGNPLWCVGSDDAHGHVPDYCGGYITVKAEEFTQDAILDAIRRGSFYASYGPDGHEAPVLRDFYVDNGVAYVSASPCRNIYLIAYRKGISMPKYHPNNGTPSSPAFTHELPLPEDTWMVKCILTGFDGSITWGQPIRL